MAGEPSSIATAALASLAAAGVATTVSIGLGNAHKATAAGRGATDDGDGFLWGLATFLSLIPLANWTAWVLLAQELKHDTEEEPEEQQKDGGSGSSALCYVFAAIYALPVLQGGLPPRASDFLLIAIGAVHIQLERISVTEPEVLLRALPPGQAESVGALGEAVTQALMGAGSRGKALVGKGKEEEKPQDPAARAELKAFDEKLGVKKQQTEKATEDDDDLGWG